MRAKTLFLLFGAIVMCVGLVLSITAARARYPAPSMTPPVPPTPGPPPTELPQVEKGDPVTTRAKAVERALAIDAVLAVREYPFTLQAFEERPDMVTVESYGTWEDASGGGGVIESSVTSQAVWVVAIKGQASLRMLGGGQGMREVDGVTYTISQQDGSLLAISSSIRE
jgi:hypothetical protein